MSAIAANAPLPELVSFPPSAATQDEGAPKVARILTNVHRRLASIISTSPEDHLTPAPPLDQQLLSSPLGKTANDTLPNGQSDTSGSIPPTPEQRRRKESIVSDTTDVSRFNFSSSRSRGSFLLQRAEKAPASVDSSKVPMSRELTRERSKSHSSTSVPGSRALSREPSTGLGIPASARSTLSRPSMHRADSLSTVLERIKRGTLSRDFWMKDSNVQSCFRCEAVFTTFRRKHHCRLCGQIFCSSCTLLTSSHRLNNRERFRACKTCSRIMDEYAAISSDDNQVGWSSEAELVPTTRDDDRVKHPDVSFSVPSDRRPMTTPLMGIPATRTPGRRSSKSAQLEIPSAGEGQGRLQGDTSRTPSALTSDNYASDTTGAHPLAQLANQLTRRMHGSFKRPDARAVPRPHFGRRSSSTSKSRFDGSDEGEDDCDDEEIMSTQHPRLLRAGSLRSTASTAEDNNFELLRKSRKRSIQKHVKTKSKSLIRQLGQHGLESAIKAPQSAVDSPLRRRARSRSYSGLGESPTSDISPEAQTYARAMLAQQLSDSGIPNPAIWSSALMPILLSVPANVQPKVKEGASAYINNYVKIKRIPGARPAHCEFISGAVFTHKLAHKKMAREVHQPRILLVSFPIEYQRGESQLMSLEPVLAQEKEFLRNLVNRMLALRPNVVIAEQSLSGLALQHLLDAGVTVAYNVKPSVIAVIAGLTGADIVTSVDRLAFQPRVGRCDLFEVKTYVGAIDGRPCKKTYVFLRGCPADLGCTIVLRGADMDQLERVKRIVEFMSYVVYNLRLETSLLRDHLVEASEATAPADYTHSTNLFDPEDLRIRSSTEVLGVFENRLLTASSVCRLSPPYLLRKAKNLESQLDGYSEAPANGETPTAMTRSMSKADDLSDLTVEQQLNVERLVRLAQQQQLKDDLEYVRKAWDALLDNNPGLLVPGARQSINVLYSTVCTETGTPCNLPTNELFEYYKDTGIDCPLGQYVEDSIHTSRKPCPIALCQRNNMEHHRSYVHGEGRVSVVIEPFVCPVPGMQQTILMWSYCKSCKTTSSVVPMSENTWAYSFGKYLELSFYSRRLRVTAGETSCDHDFCCQHVRYFGFRDHAVRFDYDPVEVMSLVMPRPNVLWRPEGFVRLKNQEFKSIQFKISAYYDSLEFRLYNMNSEMLMIDEIDAYKADLALLRQQAKDERTSLNEQLQTTHDESDPLDYLCLNRPLRAMQQKVVKWSETFEELERLYMPADKDIRKLTAAHLKKLFLPDLLTETSQSASEEMDSDVRRSASLAAVVEEGKPRAATTQTEASSVDKSEERLPNDPTEESNDEPKGFHPRRVYEPLALKPKEEPREAQDQARMDDDSPVPRSSSIPVAILRQDGARARSGDSTPNEALSPPKAASRNHSRAPSGENRSAIPIPKIVNPLAALESTSHLRKKSTTHSLTLSKQMQDLSEAVVGSAERRWNEQKKFSSVTKDGATRTKAGETRVSTLAKHFDQLSREFEKERIRARKLLHTRGRRALAVVTSKPRVAVFDNVDEAVDQTSDEEDADLEPLVEPTGEDFRLSLTKLDTSTSRPQDHKLVPVPSVASSTDEKEKSEKPVKQEADSSLNFAAGERTTLMKALSNFWAERSSSNWTPLEFPLPPTMHVFLESDVVIREDEPSSLIAFTLSAEEYLNEIANLRARAHRKPFRVDDPAYSPARPFREKDRRIEQVLMNPTGTHMRFSWGGSEGNSVRLTSRIFFAEQFDALRRYCGCDQSYVASLARCFKWDSSGGKSGAAFLKTQDERLIVKQLSKIETEQFLRFAPDYFSYMAESFFKGLPTCLCKILGFYQITSKNQVTGKYMKMDVLVMENLFYKRKTSRIFDLKGSMRNRKVQQTGKENEVLLDENFVELVAENPLFVRDHARRFLRSALHNDTLFLAQNNVMDYSLVVGIDDERHELIVGIIDFIRTYTWDKKLESWVKERSGTLLVTGGTSKQPTVVTPKQYKVRFREAMDRYIFGIKS
ncbi:Mitochondrial distribution and morphology protein 12 [Savitreella phatthalungensis]